MDLTEAIDTKDSSFMDNSEYHDTDAVPLNGPLPISHYIRDEVHIYLPCTLCVSSHDNAYKALTALNVFCLLLFTLLSDSTQTT